jgi:hypothetical protein
MTTIYKPAAVLWERVTARIVKTPGGCWEFQGCINSRGYGCVSSGAKGKTILAHRLAVLARDGKLDDSLTVDHTCHNASLTCPGGIACRHRRCVNPDHLDVCATGDNTRRAARRKIRPRVGCETQQQAELRAQMHAFDMDFFRRLEESINRKTSAA